MSDREDRDQPEGVRILGAEEAQAVLENEGRAARAAASEHSGGREGTWSATQQREAAIAEAEERGEIQVFPRPVDTDYDDEPEGLVRAQPVEAESPPLPHWTEPATGQLPAVFGDDDEDEDLSAWASFSSGPSGGPRYRSDSSEWSEETFDDLSDETTGETTRIGALADAPPPDDDAAFAAQVAARRRRGGSRPRPPVEEPEAEMLPAPSGRDLPLALLTAGAIVVVALICLSLGRTWTLVLSAAIVGMCALELANALRSRGHHPATVLALLGSVGMVFAAKHDGTAAYPVFFALVTVFSMLWFLWRVTPGRPVRGIASTVLTFGYVGVLGGFAGLLLQSPDGVGLVLGTAICTVSYDVIGYFFGSQFGQSRIAPNVSPNKTVEGTLVGFVASVVLALLVVHRIHPWTDTKHALYLGIAVGIGSILGDLCESMIKRDLELKDFGSFLPGHGGVLDRFDGLLFCLPITYYLALHLKIF
ncbi:MAG TPA: phosphatidate cytidylyltransferase [Acidimicrobiia bacterium]|jgi:phosphatidate cytidylyltransferase|nr:phosphatidate cytidylyltransferase [Acidimicrobiia bacterium]